MNHITQILSSKLMNISKASEGNEMLPACEITPKAQTCRGPWSSTMLSKVKEYRDVIKGMITFDKTSNEIVKTPERLVDSHKCQGFGIFNTSRITSSSSMPDIVKSNKVPTSGSKEGSFTIKTINSKSRENCYNLCKQKLRVSLGRSYDKTGTSDSLNYFPTDDTDNSLMSFIALEKRVQKECLEAQALQLSTKQKSQDDKTTSFSISNDAGTTENIDRSNEIKTQNKSTERDIVYPARKKISAEPFISYKQGQAELFWSDDLEDSFPEKIWNSTECLNSSEIIFENPCQSSTFCEDLKPNECTTSSTHNPPVQDSGFENNFSILRETV